MGTETKKQTNLMMKICFLQWQIIFRTFGVSEDYIKIALWNYYHRAKAVDIILGNAKIFRHYGRIDLKGSSFPVPLRANYSYRSTWGDRRGFGGLRIHEGTDIFAGYGTPVKSTTYGVVEMMGWNLYGGWRIGIRDIYNIYHYYGHLNGYSDDIKVGQIVQPGDIIGSVGSSGYGPPGTSGNSLPIFIMECIKIMAIVNGPLTHIHI